MYVRLYDVRKIHKNSIPPLSHSNNCRFGTISTSEENHRGLNCGVKQNLTFCKATGFGSKVDGINGHRNRKNTFRKRSFIARGDLKIINDCASSKRKAITIATVLNHSTNDCGTRILLNRRYQK